MTFSFVLVVLLIELRTSVLSSYGRPRFVQPRPVSCASFNSVVGRKDTTALPRQRGDCALVVIIPPVVR